MMMNNRFKLAVTLHKQSTMRFFSQIDLVRVLERALRRSHLPVYFTQGFNPRVKMSFSHALKLGVEGVLHITFYFTENISCAVLKERLSQQLPDGLTIIDCMVE